MAMHMDDEDSLKKELPVAFGVPTVFQPITRGALAKAVVPFIHASIGQMYFGPSGISSDGVPWIVLLTRDIKRPAIYRKAARIGLLGWRWNVTPSCFFSLTAMGLKEPRPHVRWMAPSDDPIVKALRINGRFRVSMAHPTGAHSGWFEAIFSIRGSDGNRTPSILPLLRQWTFPVPGIPNSTLGAPFDPLKRGDRDWDNEVPLWPDRLSDGWATLEGHGPWIDDLEDGDKKTGDWARFFHHKRARAAGLILAIRQHAEASEATSVVDAQGLWCKASIPDNSANDLLRKHPKLQQWLQAALGPESDAKQAHEAAFALLHTPADIFAFAANFMAYIRGLDDFLVAEALQQSLEAALLDARITDLGQKRPWLKNLGDSRLGLQTIAMDSSCAREDLETLWRSGLEFVDLLDAGEWFGPTDLPAPLSVVNAALEFVRVEGSIDEASLRAQQLLIEAQEARQWS
ncbi:hypothetical protein ACK9U2_005836, partial [Pseudomonas putida]